MSAVSFLFALALPWEGVAKAQKDFCSWSGWRTCIPLCWAIWAYAETVLGGELLPNHMDGEATLQQVSSAGVRLKVFLTPLTQQKRGRFKSCEASIYNSHTPSNLLLWLPHENLTKVQWAICRFLWERFLHIHGQRLQKLLFGCPCSRGAFRDSALLTDFMCPMSNGLGKAPRKGQKQGFVSSARQREGRSGCIILITGQFSLLQGK